MKKGISILFGSFLALNLLGSVLLTTPLYAYYPRVLDDSLILLSLSWFGLSVLALIWLGIQLIRQHLAEHDGYYAKLAFSSIILAILSLFFQFLNSGLSTPELRKIQRVDGHNFYIFHDSFLDPGCRVKIQKGLFLFDLMNFKNGCDASKVSISANQENFIVLYGGSVLEIFPRK